MRNKTYMVKVKMIKETEMMVSEKSMQKAVIKVADLLNKCAENSVVLDKTFDGKPNFIYKVEKIVEEPTNVQI